MKTATRRKKKRREGKDDRPESEQSRTKRPTVNETVTRTFAGNEYTGILLEDSLGMRALQTATGKYTWPGKATYEGPFVNSQIEGRGKYMWPDGSWYQGDIVNGKRHGEGIYTAPDGTTRYEGQWREGKRHGIGRLLYDALGESHYVGQWMDGRKHGQGRQVWPSKNIYEGEWRFGKMCGWGTMTWCDGGMLEHYTGMWEDDHPQGKGTHTWHAAEPKMADAGGKIMPSQQMNNCYDGEWNNGVRHGMGTFSYANGARYHGTWSENVKEGSGCYTFEDGRVYNGPFSNDQMVGPGVPEGATGGKPQAAALNIGAEDNPVRRCIDISDLIVLALPVDAGDRKVEPGSGYEDSAEVLREVHNMLLRYLGELKQLYGEYRLQQKWPGEDPFVLSLRQLWLLARDFGLSTPSCSLSRVDRAILSGPRHLQEMLPAEDLENARPLTPRQVETKRDRTSGTRGSFAQVERWQQQLPDETESVMGGQGDDDERTEVSSQISGATSQVSLAPADPEAQEAYLARISGSSVTSKTAVTSGPTTDQQGGVNDMGHHSSQADVGRCAKSLRISGVEAYPRRTDFWREDQEDLADIHSPGRQMMFRHFIEGVVRIALARFPNEQGLEQQVRRLFKERIAPNIATDRFSGDDLLKFPSPDTQKTLQGLDDTLWPLFRTHATGEGAYDRPVWAQPLAPPSPPPKLPSESKPSTAEMSMSLSEKDRKAEEDESPPPPMPYRLRRGFGGSQRRTHVQARRDVTCRVKDVLRLLDNGALLLPLPEGRGAEVLARASTNQYGSVFEGPPQASVWDVGEEALAQFHGGIENMLGGIQAASGLEAGGSLMEQDSITFKPGAREETTPRTPAAEQGAGGSAAPAEESSGGGGGRETPSVLRNIMGMGLGNIMHGGLDHQPKPAEVAARPTVVTREDTGAASESPNVQGGANSDERPESSPRALQQRDGPPTSAGQPRGSIATIEASTADSGAVFPKPEEVAMEVPLEEVRSIDFSTSFADIVAILTEVMLPRTVENLRISVATDESPAKEHVALAEYMESELTFSEFQRLLVRLVEQRTHGSDLADSMPLHRRVEAFIKLVFLPSLQAPYKPPGSEPEVPAAAGASGGEAAVEAEQPPGELPAEGSQEGQPASGSPPPAEQPEAVPGFWRGFCPDESDEFGSATVGRAWPEDLGGDPAEW